MISLSRAAQRLGVDVRSLRSWLERDCGLTFPHRGPWHGPSVQMADLRTVLARRCAQPSEKRGRAGPQLTSAGPPATPGAKASNGGSPRRAGI